MAPSIELIASLSACSVLAMVVPSRRWIDGVSVMLGQTWSGAVLALQGRIGDRGDPAAGPAGLEVQPADIGVRPGEQRQHDVAAGRVRRRVAVFAPGEQLAETALAARLDQPGTDAEGGRGQRRQALRFQAV